MRRNCANTGYIYTVHCDYYRSMQSCLAMFVFYLKEEKLCIIHVDIDRLFAEHDCVILLTILHDQTRCVAATTTEGRVSVENAW